MRLSETQSDEEQERHLVPHDDWLLRALVTWINRAHGGVGITLSVKGLLVSGIAIGFEEYFEGVAKEIRDTNVGSENTKAADNVATIFDSSLQVIRESLDEDAELAQRVGFIHLKNARFYSGNSQIPGNGGAWWRARLREVDGFFMGQLAAR